MSNTPIQAIAFDAYGTLFNIETIDQRLEFHFGKQAASIAPVWRRKQLEYTWLRTMMNRYKDFYTLTEEALEYACEFAQIELSVSVRNDLMDHYNKLEVYPEVRDALKVLSQRYQLAILSNANPELLEKAVAFNEIGSSLSAIISVAPLRQFKPVPSVYQLPVSHWDLPKESVLFISSNTWDVAGAKSFGLRVAWVQRKNSLEEKLGFSPDLKVKDLIDLASQLSNKNLFNQNSQ